VEVARSGAAAIVQEDFGGEIGRRGVFLRKGTERDGPAGFSRRGIADGEITAGGDKGAVEAELPKNGEGGIGRVSFGDAAEIDENVRAGFGEGAFLAVE
jgi:hypothetical protein